MNLFNEAPHLSDLPLSAKKLYCASCSSRIRYVDYCFEKLGQIGYKPEEIRSLYAELYKRVKGGSNFPIPCPHCGEINICNSKKGIIRAATESDKGLVIRYIPDKNLIIATEGHNTLTDFERWLSNKVED